METRTLRRAARTRPIQQLRVVVRSGPDAGKTVESSADEPVSVGVSADNQLVLTDPTVSRYHVELAREDRGVRVSDLASSNGTYCGSIRIQDAVVPPDTILKLGDTELAVVDGAQVSPVERDQVAIPGLIGESEPMQRAAHQIRRLATSNVSVFVFGETGTGKELVARALHDLGPRREQPFVIVDCGSLPATLIASELLGHERGAFTGATERQPGAFERAHQGTLFLDEIGELPLALQPALLGALERRRVRRLGGDREITVDVRVVCASNRDLRSEVNRGNFRADLFFRLAAARIELPPLRARPDDLPALVTHFVAEATGDPNRVLFEPATLEALKRQPWSGNVRELRNVVESAIALGAVEVPGAVAPPEEPGAPALIPYAEARRQAIAAFEEQYVKRAISLTDGNASKAARITQMDRPYLVSMLKRYGLR